MQLTYFVVNNWFSGLTVAKMCRYFLKRPTADSCCKILHTHTTKNQKLLFTYVNAAVKTSWWWYNKNYNLISVKTRSKEVQRSRPTLQWDQRRTDRTNKNFWLHAFQVKHEQHSRFTLEVKEEQIATHLRRNEAAKWHWTRDEQEMSLVETPDFSYIPYIPYIRGGRLTNWVKSSQGQSRS